MYFAHGCNLCYVIYLFTSSCPHKGRDREYGCKDRLTYKDWFWWWITQRPKNGSSRVQRVRQSKPRTSKDIKIIALSPNDLHTSLQAYGSPHDPAWSFVVLAPYFTTNHKSVWHRSKNTNVEYQRSAWTAEITMTPQRTWECYVPARRLNSRNHYDTLAKMQFLSTSKALEQHKPIWQHVGNSKFDYQRSAWTAEIDMTT